MTIRLRLTTLFVFCAATSHLYAASAALSQTTTASTQSNTVASGVFSLANNKQARGKILEILNQLRSAVTNANQNEQQKLILRSINKKMRKFKQNTLHPIANNVEPITVTTATAATSDVATAQLSQASTTGTATTSENPETGFAITYAEIQSICQELRAASDQTAQAHIIKRIDALQQQLSAPVCASSSNSSSTSASSSSADEEESPVITIVPDDADTPALEAATGVLMGTQSAATDSATEATQSHARKTSLWGADADAEVQAINAEILGTEAAASSSASAQSTSDAASVSLSVVNDQAAIPEAASGHLVSASDTTTSSSSSAAMTITPTQSMEEDDAESADPVYLHSIPQSSPSVPQQDDIPVKFSEGDEDFIEALAHKYRDDGLSASKIIVKIAHALIGKQFQLSKNKTRAFRLATERYEKIFNKNKAKNKATESITEFLNKFEHPAPLQRIGIQAKQAQIIQTDLQFAEKFYQDHKDEIEGTFDIARELSDQQNDCAVMSDFIAEALFCTYITDDAYKNLNLPALKKIIKAKYDKQLPSYTLSLSASPDPELFGSRKSFVSLASNKHPFFDNQRPPKRLSRWERFKKTTLGCFLTHPWTKGIGRFCIIGGILVGVYYTVNHYYPGCTI